MTGDFQISLLCGAEQHQVSKFRLSGETNASLVRFIRRDASNSARANLTQTFVAIRSDSKKVLAYVSLMCAQIDLERTYPIQDKAGADRYDNHPAIRIARLAVEESCQRSGLGRLLVQFAIGLVQRAIQPNVGCRFVVLDAKRQSVSFYESLGFRVLDTTSNRGKDTPLMFLDLQNHE